jgi:hypothetical protein
MTPTLSVDGLHESEMLLFVAAVWVKPDGGMGRLVSGHGAVAATTRTIAERLPESFKLATPAV